MKKEQFEQRYPLVETIGSVEIRRFGDGFDVGQTGLWSVTSTTMEGAREWARKANELMSLGYELYGFNGVNIFHYEKLVAVAKTLHPSQMKKYWLYI